MRGFTLVEVIMASAIGGVLLLACLALFSVMDRTDQALSVRHRNAADLAMVHLTMERTFSNLLMASQADAQRQQENRDSIMGGQRHQAARPRLLLDVDPMFPSVQRLEVVLMRSPVPPGFGREDTAAPEEHLMAGPVRGVFELRPEGEGLSMWWRPLPRAEDEVDGYRFSLDPREDQYAVKLASGIEEAQWLVFKNRERLPALSAFLFHDLPAHMELNVRMSSGYVGQWMFEVAWMNGPETPEEMAEEAEALAEPAVAAPQRGGRGRPRATPTSPTPENAP